MSTVSPAAIQAATEALWLETEWFVPGVTEPRRFAEAALAAAEPHIRADERARVAAHGIVRAWQERPGEWSWSCRCGFVAKHQAFGEVMPCPEATR